MFLRDSIIRKRKERVVEGLWTTTKESRPCGRSSSLLHRCSLEGHCLWYVRVYSSDLLWEKHWAHLHDDHSCGLATGCSPCLYRCLLPGQKPTRQSFISVRFSFLLLELPCYVTLLCGVEQLPNLISEDETRVSYTMGENTYQGEII